MTEWQVLNNVAHSQMRVSRRRDSHRHFAQIVASEFLKAAPHYPILFTKHPETGAFYAGVIMGTEPGHNLLTDQGQLADYRPADLERQGFFIANGQLVIDTSHVVFSDADGHPLFDVQGQAEPVLTRIQHALATLERGIPETDAVIRRFLSHRLIEPIDVTLNSDDGRPVRLEGLYTISLDALHGLDDAAALEMFRAGDLQLAYVQAASVQHLHRLGRLRNERLFEPVA